MNKIVLSLLAIDLFGTSLAFLVQQPSLLGGLRGFWVGFTVFVLPTFAADLLVHLSSLRGDPLFYLRRTFALSLFSSTIWILVLILGAVLNFPFPDFAFPSHAFYLALFLVIPLRSIAIFSMSTVSLPKRFVFSISQPLACSLAAVLVLGIRLSEIVTILSVATLLGFLFSASLLTYVERRGTQIIGFSPLRMFRAFLRDWLDGDYRSFEGYLEELGVDETMSIAVIGFRSRRTGRSKALLVAPNFHPGPFLNVGSSALPFMIQRLLERETGGLVAVAHGVSGHELNLVSQRQNERVLRELLKVVRFESFSPKATNFVRSKMGLGTASCQVFGECALVTLTTSPADMEDIPLETGALLEEEGARIFSRLALVDAHNCLSAPTVLSDGKLRDLTESAVSVMKRCAEEAHSTLKFGAAKVVPEGFTLREGVGPGGIVAFAVETMGQLVAYVTVDGNNMASGLRERFLDVMRSHGFVDGEVMTSDTHMVNGLVPAKLGYHPFGAAGNTTRLIANMEEALLKAREDLEEVEVASSKSKVPVKVLGLGALSNLTDFVHSTAKLTAFTLFPAIAVLALVSLFFLI